MSYPIWQEQYTVRGRTRVKHKFECDCGRELVVERTECDRCGAHYDYVDGRVIQVAPPIGEE